MALLNQAIEGRITPEMEEVAKAEGLEPVFVREGVAGGVIVIPKNTKHNFDHICGIGAGLRTKVNANLGTSADFCDLEYELKKLDIAKRCGVDTVMDLSTGGNLRHIRREIISQAGIPVGTVPIYQVMVA